jgi:hypothetical protein
MKKLLVFLLMVVAFSSHSFGQNDKCLNFSNDIIKDVKGKIISQYLSFDQATYTIKAEVPSTYDIDKIKMVCDTAVAKVSIDWKLNYDKNWEKTVIVGGKTTLITFYPGDKILYFEFPK